MKIKSIKEMKTTGLRINKRWLLLPALIICLVCCGIYFFGRRTESMYCKVVIPLHRVVRLHPEFEGYINDSIMPAIRSLDCDLSQVALICLLEEDYVSLNVYSDRKNVPLRKDPWIFSILPLEDNLNLLIVRTEWHECYAVEEEEILRYVPSDVLPTFRLGENMSRDLVYTDTIMFKDDTVFFVPPILDDSWYINEQVQNGIQL